MTSGLIGPVNRPMIIPAPSVENCPGGGHPLDLAPVIRLTGDKAYAVMTHELASLSVLALGAEFGAASQHPDLNFLFDHIRVYLIIPP